METFSGIERERPEHQGGINQCAIDLFNTEVRNGAFETKNPNIVLRASHKIIENELSPNDRHQQSMVSKIAFFANPNYYLPMDMFSKRGIWLLTKQHNDLSRVSLSTLDNYSNYLRHFDKIFELSARAEILEECNRNWVKELMERNYMQVNWAHKTRFLRKAFDTYLMLKGGYS